MAVPAGYDFYTWVNSQVAAMNDVANEIYVFKKYWASLTVAQQAALKASEKSKIDAIVTTLTAIKAEIDNV